MNPAPHTAAANLRLADLLARTAQKDRAAFRALYQETSSRLFGVLIRILHDRDEAADILQEVYITIWRRAISFDRDKGKALTWMAVITRNAGIDALRRHKPNHVSDECCAELVDGAPSAFDVVKSKNAAHAVSQHLENLSPKMREAIRLYYLEELAMAEVAAIMQTPLNTTKSWIRRGLQQLQSSLSGQQLLDFV